MTARHHCSIGFLLLSVALVSSSCTTVATGPRFTSYFVPPAPKQAVITTAADAAPQITGNVYLAEAPTFLYPNIQPPSKPNPVDFRVERANTHFDTGKKLYEAGDLDGARKEFDLAVDTLLSVPENIKDRSKAEKRLEEMISAIHRYDVNGLGSGDLAGQPGYDKAPLEDILDMTFASDPRLKPRVAEQVQATASQLPLQVNEAVLGYIHYFSSDKGRRTLVAGLKRSGKYRPLIQKILAEEGVPQELIYLAQAESGFLPRAVSNKAATGMWQFVKFRGQEYGLMQTGHTDERLDPEKATRSAARHLRDLYTKFGDWYLAIAAYNCGPGGLDRAVERTGYADFWKLRSMGALPKETANYVPIILAMTIMHKNAKEYGLENIEMDVPLEYETLRLTAATHLALVADIAERPLSDIQELNPSLLTNIPPAGYELHVPSGSAQMVLAGLQNIPESRRASWRIHRVEPGDTLASIAKRYNTSLSSLEAANGNLNNEIGDLLVIPARTTEARAKQGVRGSRAKTAGLGYVSSRSTVRKSTIAGAAHPNRRRPGSLAAVMN